jgi:tetratricopeptide (TPR) repeat protein
MNDTRTARTTTAILMTLTLAAAGTLPALAEGITKVKGTVVDHLGKPMVGVPIYFEGVDVKKTVGPLRTNKKGEYLIATLDVTVVKKWKVIPRMEGYKTVKVYYEVIDSSMEERGKQDMILGSKQEYPEIPFALIGDTGRNVVNFVLAKDAEFIAATQAEQKKRKEAAAGGAAETAAAPGAAGTEAPAAATPKVNAEGAQQLTKAKQLADAGNHAQAIELYRAFLAKDPTGNPPAYYYLGKSLFATKDYQGAAQAFSKALELQPKMVNAHAYLGNVALQDDDAATAVKEYEQEVVLQPDSDKVLYNLGKAYAKSAQPEKALEVVERATTINPSNAEALMFLGTLYDEKGDKAKAEEAYQKVAAINPHDAATLFYNVGVKAWNDNLPKEAIQAYNKALAIDPTYAQSHRELGKALMAQQDFQGAIKQFEEYLRLSPSAPDQKEIKDTIALLKK